MESQFRNRNLKDPFCIREAASLSYIDTFFSDPSRIKNTTDADFKVNSFDNVHFLKLNSYPTKGKHAAAKYYNLQSIDEPTCVSNFEKMTLKIIL